MIDRYDRKENARWLAISMLGALSLAAPAAAQDIDTFGSVETRFRPDYSAPPITVGSFELLPRVELDTEYVDNLFASDALKVDDTILTVKPRLSIRDRRPDRQIRLDLSGGYSVYLDNQVDDRLQWMVRGNARFGLGTRTRPFFGINLRQNDSTNRRSSEFYDLAQPLKLRSYSGNAGLEQEFGPFTATAQGEVERTEYDGDTIIASTPVDASFRNFTRKTGRAQIAYSLNPAQRIYIEGEFNTRDYGSNGPLLSLPAVTIADRSSDSFTLSVGYSRELTELLLLDVNVGYLRQTYDDASFRRVSTIAFDASLYYSPTRLTRILARVSRSVDDTVDPLYSGLVRTEFSAGIEHELRRFLILSVNARYASIDAGAGANDNSELRLVAQARYLFSPKWFARLRTEYFKRDGITDGTQKKLMLGIGYNF